MSLEATGITEEQPEQLSQQELDDEAEFNSGFEGEPDTPADEKPADQDTPNTADETEDELVDEDDKQQTQEAAPTEDGEPAANAAETPADPVAELRAQLQALQAANAALDHRLKSTEGRVGAIAAGKVAAKAATEAGGKAPTDKQIETAFKAGGEKVRQLKEEFPDFGDALEEAIADIRIDPEQIIAQAEERAYSRFRTENEQAIAQRQQEEAQRDRATRENAVEAKHQGWKQTIAKPEFQQFLDTITPIGPSQAEVAAVKASFAQKDWDTANSRVQALTAAYPEWAKAGGHKRFSARPDDVIELLDAFGARHARATAKQTNQQRLRTAAAPKTRGAGGPTANDPEAEFNAGFYGK